MKKRMNELEIQLKIQNENLNKISSLANKKEEKLNNDILKYLRQINDLKNELELLNCTITNLTEEKENNTIKLTELIHENEQLKKNNSIKKNSNTDIQNKKYEDLILKFKKNIANLNEEKKSLEEIIFKQKEKVSELSIKVENTKKEIIKKDIEIKESIEYNAKLAKTINIHKKEIQKLKQSINNNSDNKNKDAMNIMNLQKEIQNIKKEIEYKDNKINLISMNNKILQGKLSKLTQTTKNGFKNEQSNNNYVNNNIANNIKNINNKDAKSSIFISKNDKILHKDKNKVFIVAKPKQGLYTPGVANGRKNSTNIRVKNDFYKNNEDNISNIDSENKSKYSNLQQVKKPQKRNNSNINNIKRQNDINSNNLNNINNNINKSNYMNDQNDINHIIEKKYKEIESKYKKEINKEMKDDTLFDEDIINNFDIKEEIIVGNNNPIEVVSNMASQTLKPKKNNNKNIIDEQSLNNSQEKDFQIIESYCLLSGQKEEGYNDDNNILEKYNKENSIKEDESKIENNQVRELHNHVRKILEEFN